MEPAQAQRVVLVTGANRGIGFEVCRQLAQAGNLVILTAREQTKAQAAAATLGQEGYQIHPYAVDVSDAASVAQFSAKLTAEIGRLDVLINNAGAFYDNDQRASTADLAYVEEAFATNLFGAWRMIQACLPLLRASQHARIVNVASEAGSFGSDYGLASSGYGATPGGLPAYGLTKAALNALTVKLANELRGTAILVNSVCPGYTATHPAAVGARPVTEGAASVIWAAMLPDDGPSGGFFRDGQPLAW